MTMGQQKDRQGDLMVRCRARRVMCFTLQSVLIEGGFDSFADVGPIKAGGAFGAADFRMHLVGYFEGIDSERGLEWRCSDGYGSFYG